MKNKMILNIITLLIMGVVLFAMSANVFATSDGPTDLNDFFGDEWEDQELEDEDEDESNTNTNTNTNPSTNNTNTNTNTGTSTNTSTNTNTNNTTNNTSTNTNKEETLPDAGIAEDTMMVLAIVVLGITAIYAYKKVNEYKNI